MAVDKEFFICNYYNLEYFIRDLIFNNFHLFSLHITYLFNMVHFFVSVNEGQKNIINQQIIKVNENICIFDEIYEAITEGIFDKDVKVYVGKGDGKWNYLKEGLYDEISLMSELGLKYIRFVIQNEEIQEVPQQVEQNIFDIMMEHSRQPYFPKTKRKDTQYNILH